jgi:solute carrier family 32 (vesicular inhibitory amino acid transporter)
MDPRRDPLDRYRIKLLVVSQQNRRRRLESESLQHAGTRPSVSFILVCLLYSEKSNGFVNEKLIEEDPRSSFSLDTIRHAGGVNSIDNFARSWTRAAGFFEVAPQQRHQYTYAGDEDTFATDDEDDLEAHLPSHSLFGRSYGSIASVRTVRRDSFNIPNVDSAAAVALLNTHEGNMVPDELISSQIRDLETEPLLVRKVAVDDGKVVNLIVGQSTMPQTVFNSVNVLIGIGLLSLPLGLKYSGW